MLLYPVYPLLFAETGLSAAETSTLFIVWSVTAFALEIPAGPLADLLPRNRLLAVAPILAGTGFLCWTFVPSYWSFAAGFVLWGTGSALRSGTFQALVYDELNRAGVPGSYERVIGRSQAVGTLAIMIASGLAAPVFGLGGYRALGVASVTATVLAGCVGWSLPAAVHGRPAQQRPEGYLALLRAGLGEARGAPPVRRLLLLSAALMGVAAMDEYVPLLAQATGVGGPGVALLVLLVTGGVALGGWLAGRGDRWAAPALAGAAGLLVAGALAGRVWGLVPVAAAFGVLQWATVATEARLQEHIEDRARATVTSIAGLGAEACAITVFTGYAIGAGRLGPGPLFAFAGAPLLLLAFAMRRLPVPPGTTDPTRAGLPPAPPGTAPPNQEPGSSTSSTAATQSEKTGRPCPNSHASVPDPPRPRPRSYG